MAVNAGNLPKMTHLITFNMLLERAGIDPKSVYLVRHQDHRVGGNNKLYAVWRDKPESFEIYQRVQKRDRFRIDKFIASFVVPPVGETLFVGLYKVKSLGTAPKGFIEPVSGKNIAGGKLYEMVRDDRLSKYAGLLVIDWGPGYRSWVQHAGRKDKPVVQLRRKIEEERFPGYLRLIRQLSEIPSLYPEWIDRLKEARGIYLLTCPRTKEQYVGAATGADGFYGRWIQHAAKGGDAVRFKSRDPSDYQVSILEVVGSGATDAEIFVTEQLWIRKLQSVSMGLNGNPVLRVERDKSLNSKPPKIRKSCL